MKYEIKLQKRGYGKEEYKKQLNKAKKEKKKKKKKKNVVIVVNGSIVKEPKCDKCNYCECETCPTWHGEPLEDETND